MSPVAPFATPRVLVALRTILLGDPTLVARLARAPAALGGGPGIYTYGSVPEGAAMDYLIVGPFTERPDGTMGGGWGSELTAAIKLVTQNRNVAQTQETIDQLVGLLHGVKLTVAEYANGDCNLSVVVDGYDELVAGVVTLHYPTLWTIWVHQ